MTTTTRRANARPKGTPVNSYVYIIASIGFSLMLIGTLAAVGLFDVWPTEGPSCPLQGPAALPRADAPACVRPRALPSLELHALPPTPTETLVELDDPGWSVEGPTLLDLPVYQPSLPPPARAQASAGSL